VLQLEADDFLQAGAEGRVDAAEVDALMLRVWRHAPARTGPSPTASATS
jgi:hypothetical protein